MNNKIKGNKNEINQKDSLKKSEEKSGNNYIENSSKNEDLNFNRNYEKFDINKDYYLICPDCNLFITRVESVEYDSNFKDFVFNYKCFCKENKEYYLYVILKDEKPICEEHKNEIKFNCRNCKEQICEDCRNNNKHDEHEIINIINCEVISDSIMKDISDKKNEFKGFNIFEKIYTFYKITITFIEKEKLEEINSEQNSS